MIFIKQYILLVVFSLTWAQLVNYEAPLSHIYNINKIKFHQINDIINTDILMQCTTIDNNRSICQTGVNIQAKDLFDIEFLLPDDYQNKNIFILESTIPNIIKAVPIK